MQIGATRTTGLAESLYSPRRLCEHLVRDQIRAALLRTGRVRPLEAPRAQVIGAAQSTVGESPEPYGSLASYRRYSKREQTIDLEIDISTRREA